MSGILKSVKLAEKFVVEVNNLKACQRTLDEYKGGEAGDFFKGLYRRQGKIVQSLRKEMAEDPQAMFLLSQATEVVAARERRKDAIEVHTYLGRLRECVGGFTRVDDLESVDLVSSEPHEDQDWEKMVSMGDKMADVFPDLGDLIKAEWMAFCKAVRANDLPTILESMYNFLTTAETDLIDRKLPDVPGYRLD